MWPRGRSGLGPGSSPVKRAAARASTICALPVPRTARTCSNERTSVSSRAVALNESGAIVALPLSTGRPRPASGAGRRRGSRRARARTRGTSTRPAPRCRDPPCRRPRHASRCRRRAPRHCARKAPATAACAAATSRDRRCCRCRRRPRPGCGPPGTRRPGRAPSSADATSRPVPAPRCRRPPSAASQAGVTTSGVSPPLTTGLRTRA